MTETISPSNVPARQWRLIGALFAIVVVFLALGYFWFLRTDDVVLARDLRPDEAATIVEELKAKEIHYRLSDGGTTILVAADRADDVRLDLASSELPLKGTVGFELFNESDMGLTDFAQKVNYQRALQGEITRTLLAMEGIAAARVHIALPERSLFRAARSEPRAAVTISPREPAGIGAERVAGIQRLVAAAVPDLAAERVAVLNERGELLTPAYADVAAGDGSALERGYAERVRSTLAAVRPGLAVDVRVTAVPRRGTMVGGGTTASAPSATTRDHAVRIVLFFRSPLGPGDEQAIEAGIRRDLGLDPASGDAVEFALAPQVAPPMPVAPEVSRAAPDQPALVNLDNLFADWLAAMGLLAAIGAVGAFLWTQRARARRRDALIIRIREQIRLPASDAR